MNTAFERGGANHDGKDEWLTPPCCGEKGGRKINSDFYPKILAYFGVKV